MTWLRRTDLLAPLAGLTALVVYLLHGFDGFLSRDLAVYAYGGQMVAEGVPPYVGLVNRAGPLAHLIPGVGVIAARAVGADDILGMRVLFMLISVACIVVAYVLGRDLFRSRLAGVATAAALLCLHGFIKYATYGPREKTAMVLFLLVALLAVVHQQWGLTGSLTALATLTWQPVFFALMAGTVVAVLLGLPEGRLRALARVAVGGLVPTAVTVAAYAAVGALDVFLDDFLLINARYTRQGSALGEVDHTWDTLTSGFGASLAVIFLGMVALLACAVGALLRRGDQDERDGPRDPRTAALVGSGAALLVGIAWTIRAYDSWPDAFPLLPCAALGIGGVSAAISRRVPARVAVAVGLSWVLVATGMALTYSLDRQTTLDRQRDSVTAVLRLLPPGTRILSVESPQPLVLSRTRNLSRFQLFGNGLVDYVDDTWPGGIEGYGQWVADRRPTLIALSGHTMPAWLEPTLEASYRRIGHAPGWDWYVHDDVGAPTRRALRTAVRTALSDAS